MMRRNFALFALFFAVLTSPPLAPLAIGEERVVHTLSVKSGEEVALPPIEESAKLLGWRMVVGNTNQLKSAESCEEKRCGELVIRKDPKGEAVLEIPGRFGAMKALGLRSGNSELPTVDIATLGAALFKNTAEFSYEVEILIE